MATDHLLTHRRAYGMRISWATRKSEDAAEKTRLSLESELPSLTAQHIALQSQSEIDFLYRKYSELRIREFTVSARPRLGRYMFFWTDELDELAGERTSAYRTAKLLNTTEAWAEYTQKARGAKRVVAREKLNAIRSFCDELQNTQLTQSQAIIKRIVKAKQRYVVHHQPQRTTLNLREYELSLNEVSRAPRQIPWSDGVIVHATGLQK